MKIEDIKDKYHWYQTFPFVQGASDSKGKLKALCLPDLKDQTVLDVGCCEGFFCFEMTKMGAKVFGIDVDARFIEMAKLINREKYKYKNIVFKRMDVEDLSVQESFDYILLISTIHHLNDPINSLIKLSHMCKKGLIIEFPVKSEGMHFDIVEPKPGYIKLFPTIDGLTFILEHYFKEVKVIGMSVKINEDARYVIHAIK